MLLSYTLVDFHLFYDGAIDIQIWAPPTRCQCKVCDTQVSVKACGPLVNIVKVFPLFDEFLFENEHSPSWVLLGHVFSLEIGRLLYCVTKKPQINRLLSIPESPEDVHIYHLLLRLSISTPITSSLWLISFPCENNLKIDQFIRACVSYA